MITFERLLVPMDDLPGYVHGIVSLDPPMVQCDTCGTVATGDSLALTVLTSGIHFDAFDHHSTRRCRDCWAAVGVTA